MRAELENHLFDAAPRFLQLMPPFDHFFCGDGWFDLLRSFLEKAEAVVQGRSEPQWVHAELIKEKLGRLRVYTSRRDEEIDELIDIFEDESLLVCMDCSASGILRKRRTGQLIVNCDRCFDDSEAKNP